MGARFPDIDWYCDRCNAYLNDQPGFDDHKYTWKCTECGHKNSISSDDIYESEEDLETMVNREVKLCRCVHIVTKYMMNQNMFIVLIVLAN